MGRPKYLLMELLMIFKLIDDPPIISNTGTALYELGKYLVEQNYFLKVL